MTAKKVLQRIHAVSSKVNTDVYAVGGIVRDGLLKKKDHIDLDFVVLGSGLTFAQEYIKQFSEDEATLIEFPDFDTARIVFDGKRRIEVEIAGARKESYHKTSRKPTVESATLEEDLSRRDFTVNAMAQKVIKSGLSKKIIDPFGGQKDLEKRLLRTPLEPDETFSEDPLRILRAARFAAQLNFAIEKKTLTAMHENRARLSIISKERIQEELYKLLATNEPSIGLYILHQTGVLDEFLPEVSVLSGVEDMYGKKHKDNLSHSFKVVDNIAKESGNILLRLAGLLHDIGKPGTKKFAGKRGWTFDMHEHLGRKMVRHIGKRLRMSKDDTEYVAHLVRWHMQPINLMDKGVTDSAVRRLIVNMKDDLKDLLILCRSDITTGNPKKLQRRLKNYDYLDSRIDEVIERDKLRAFQSPVRGEEIMKLTGLKPGPTVGKIKKAIEEAIIEGEIKNEYDDALSHFEKIKDMYVKGAEDWENL